MLLQAAFFPNKAKQKHTQLFVNASPPSRLLRAATSPEMRCWLPLFHRKDHTHPHKSLYLWPNDTSKLFVWLVPPLGRTRRCCGHTFYFGGLLLHVLGVSLAQVVGCCHGRRGKGHVADGTTLAPVFPTAAFLLAVLCTQNRRVAEAGRDLCKSPRPTFLR